MTQRYENADARLWPGMLVVAVVVALILGLLLFLMP